MPDLFSTLAELGAASRAAVWVPVLAWTALAVVAGATLRLVRPSPSVGLWTRGALLALLPALLLVPTLLAPWVPAFRSAPPIPEIASANLISAEIAPALTPPGTAEVAASLPIPIFDVVAGLMSLLAVAASLVALGVLAGGLSWLMRYRRSLEAASAPVQADARVLVDRLGLRRAVEVMTLEPSTAPFTVGWRRPVVAIPSDLTGEPLQFALAHEMAHVRDAHFEWHLAERVVRALFVWHPLVHVLGRGLALDRERVADAAVVQLWPNKAERYGRLLATFASQSSPPLALAASSSTLLHRLTAMTRLRPDRRRLARTVGLALFAAPLLLAASAVPDAQQAPRLAGPPAAPTASAVPSDTLSEYMDKRQVWSDNGRARIEITLKPGTPRRIAVAIADYYADGDIRGELAVRYDGVAIMRSTLRKDAFPPPPPPPAAPPSVRAPEPPVAPRTPTAPEPPPDAPMPPSPPAAPSPPPPPAAAPAPPPPPSIYDLSDDELGRLAVMLQEQMVAVERETNDLVSIPEPEREAASIRLRAREHLVSQRYQMVVSVQESRRLDQLVEEARGGK